MDPLIYFIIAVYVLDLRLYSILFCGFLISKINVALQLVQKCSELGLLLGSYELKT